MQSHIRYTVAALVIVAGAPLLASDPGTGNWPMWGGTPDRNMVSTMKGLPASWDVPGKKNVKWEAALGSQTYGNATVAGGKVFVTDYVRTSGEAKNDFGSRAELQGKERVLCLNAADGAVLWRKDLNADYKTRTPTWGLTAAPLVDRGLVIVQAGGEQACLVAFDKATGDIKWEQKRPQAIYAHSTPVIVDVNGKAQMLVSANKAIESLNHDNGEMIWWCAAPGGWAPSSLKVMRSCKAH